jgi:hypothetical protein
MRVAASVCLWISALSLFAAATAPMAGADPGEVSGLRITILYDAFGAGPR